MRKSKEMINAYDKNYLYTAQRNLGSFLDYSVNTLHYSLETIWKLFLGSSLSSSFERGDSKIILGLSGEELAYKVITATGYSNSLILKEREYSTERTREYWTGWSLAYYQWFTSLSFDEIDSFISIIEILDLYNPYHEMDISKFVEKMEEYKKERVKSTKLKRLRENAGLTQNELACISEVPLRTIQQYEQRQKDINHANGETLLRLARALSTSIENLFEK